MSRTYLEAAVLNPGATFEDLQEVLDRAPYDTSAPYEHRWFMTIQRLMAAHTEGIISNEFVEAAINTLEAENNERQK